MCGIACASKKNQFFAYHISSINDHKCLQNVCTLVLLHTTLRDLTRPEAQKWNKDRSALKQNNEVMTKHGSNASNRNNGYIIIVHFAVTLHNTCRPGTFKLTQSHKTCIPANPHSLSHPYGLALASKRIERRSTLMGETVFIRLLVARQ
jgi:hypothetical protein